MKKLITFLITLHASLFTLHIASAQWGCTCLPEGITFNTQEQIDSFQINYPGCIEIEGNVKIQGGDITNLNGLSVLTSIGGYLEISDNEALTSLTGLEGLNSIGSSLLIGYGDPYSGNPSLTSLAGLEGLTSIGGNLEIRYNDALTSLTGLEGLTSIGGSLMIGSYGDLECAGNPSLSSLASLNNLTYIGENLLVICNNALTSLEGLGGLTYIGGDLEISSNDIRTSLTGLDNVTSIGGDLRISYNHALTSLTGLEGLTSIGGYLAIESNYSLTSLTGLEGLTSIGGFLEIKWNDALTSLTGLEGLTSIGGNLDISYNHNLTGLTGIDNIDAGSIGKLRIVLNYNLSTCEVQSICDYLASPNGTIEIWGNAAGCDSEEEVEAACLAVGVEESSVVSRQSSVRVFPNPTYEIVHIEYEIENPSPVRIRVFNAMGGIVADLSDSILAKGKHQITWNATELPAGVYFCRVQAGELDATVKLVKQ